MFKWLFLIVGFIGLVMWSCTGEVTAYTGLGRYAYVLCAVGMLGYIPCKLAERMAE